MEILGIDIGGSGIKGAPVDVERGELTAERHRIPTPDPSKPEAVVEVVAQIVNHFSWRGPVGCTFPGIVKHGIVCSAANVDKRWTGVNGTALIAQTIGCSVVLLNDADAAGIAEVEFGAGRNHPGVVIMLTFGTGIGSAIFTKGQLLPNTEFGHLQIRGKDAEHRAASRIRKEEKLSWKEWAGRVNEFLDRLDFLFSPDLFIFGGGVSKKHEKFFADLETSVEVVPAQLLNNAGIIGAAMAAHDSLSRSDS